MCGWFVRIGPTQCRNPTPSDLRDRSRFHFASLKWVLLLTMFLSGIWFDAYNVRVMCDKK